MDIVVTSLPYLGLSSLTGPDAETFLQGQASCDVAQCTSDTSITGALCNPQGRMYSSFRLAKTGEENYLLRTQADIAESTVAGLEKYIVFSKAEIAQAGNYSVYGISGSEASAFVAEIFGAIPPQSSASLTIDSTTLIRLDESSTRFECWTSPESAIAKALENKNQTNPELWKKDNILAGWGEVEASSVNLFLPQMLNYQITGQLSFSKGCYTGQEVVARMHYRGKLKRRMYLASVSSASEPLAGQALLDGASEQSIGNVVNATGVESGQYTLLAVITRAQADIGKVYLGADGSEALTIETLPYQVED